MKQAVLQVPFVSIVVSSLAQNAKKSLVIGENAERPNAVLFLNPSNRDQGFLPPQLSAQERIDVSPSSPEDDGLLVFDTDEKSYYHWKNNAWVKGLSGDQILNYNSGSHIISLSGGGDIDISDLKEIPALANEAGKFLSTDGNSITWSQLPVSSLAYNNGNHTISLAPDGGYIDVSDLKEIPSVTNESGKFLSTNGTDITWSQFPAHSLYFNSSDHSLTLSPSGSTVDLGSLKEVPQITGNSGKYLTTDGAQLLWANEPPVISYVTIDPSDFMALKADQGSGGHVTAIFQTDNTFITANDGSVSTHQMAPVHLPHNATIQEVIVYYQDSEPTRNIQVKLFRKKLDGGNDELFAWTSSGNSGGIQNEVITTFNGLEKVDNEQYTYRVLVIFDLSGLVSLPGNAYERIYGIRFKYQQ